MAIARWLETDTYSNKDISTAVSIGVYTADADRFVLPQLLIDQAAGNGDYVYYVTLQVGGAGSSYVFGPKTVAAAASGETAIGSQGSAIFVRSGDVLTVYVDGLAGDTSTPDTIVRWAEMATLRPTSADRTLAVDESGNVVASNALDAAGTRSALGMAAANLDAQIDALPTAAEAASATRSELATELARIDVATSTRLATAGYTAPPAVGAIADAIADEPMAGHTTPGTAAAAWSAAGAAGDPWASDLVDGDYNDPDTAGYIIARLAGIDVSAVTQVAASNAGHLTITIGLTFDEAVTGLTIPADWVSALWTLKNNARDADTAALVQLRATNPAAGGDGLQRLNGAALVAPTTAADGELTVTQASGRIDVWLSDEMTALLGAATAVGWDVKFIDAAGDSTGQRGTADVVLTETKSTA